MRIFYRLSGESGPTDEICLDYLYQKWTNVAFNRVANNRGALFKVESELMMDEAGNRSEKMTTFSGRRDELDAQSL